MKKLTAPIPFAGSELSESRHVCVLFNSEGAVICTYNLAKIVGDTVIDIMRTHPIVIIGGILQHNPFFVLPDVFLRELRERRAKETRVRSTAA
jgi:hypothetical protein